MSCSNPYGHQNKDLLAIIVNFDNVGFTIDATGSVGDDVRAVIKRDLAIIETTPGEPNIGSNQIPYTAALQNGDVLCVQATCTDFATFDEDCKTIPTPDFGFVPITLSYGGQFPIRISFEMCQSLFPNCGGSGAIQANFTVTDASGNTGTIQLLGTRNSIHAIHDTNFLQIDGVDGADSISTPFGSVNVSKTFDVGYNVNENITVELNVIDCVGWINIDPAIRCTNAIMTHRDEYLMDHDGNFIAFIK